MCKRNVFHMDKKTELRSGIRSVNNTHQCEDQGWKYRETYSTYRTGCTFDPLRYHDIPVMKENAISNLILCALELSEFYSNISTLQVGLCVLNAKLFKVTENSSQPTKGQNLI